MTTPPEYRRKTVFLERLGSDQTRNHHEQLNMLMTLVEMVDQENQREDTATAPSVLPVTTPSVADTDDLVAGSVCEAPEEGCIPVLDTADASSLPPPLEGNVDMEKDVVAPLRCELPGLTVPVAHTLSFHEEGKNTFPAHLIRQLSSGYLEARRASLTLLPAQRALLVHAKPPTLLDLAKYHFNQRISSKRGQAVVLALTGTLCVIFCGLLLKASQWSVPFHEQQWSAWTFLVDTGSHTRLVSTIARIAGALTTVLGILYFSVVMGFIVDAIRAKMDLLKKGRSMVAEVNHSLILGWTDKTMSLIRELCIANESEHGGVIVVLAEMEKEILEAELAAQMSIEELRGSRVVFRSGSPLSRVDLIRVSAHTARSIVIMADNSSDADQSDAMILRIVLNIKTLPSMAGHVVAELRDIDNTPLLKVIGGDLVEIVVSHDIVGRLILMAARSPGLARVFSNLLGFDGCEFYMKEWPTCTGVAFGDLAERFPQAIPIGLKRASTGRVVMNPDLDVVVEEGDEVIVLAEDDDSYEARHPVDVDAGASPDIPEDVAIKECILMCGWRRDIRDMIRQLDLLVLPGTELHMVCEEPSSDMRELHLRESGLDVNQLKNVKITHYEGNTAMRRHMDELPLETYTSIMILADQELEDDIMNSDSHSLVSLLTIRDLQRRRCAAVSAITLTPSAYDGCKCICELSDARTQKTISQSTAIQQLSEFIQSNELVTSILAMVAENRHVHAIIEELLGSKGSHFVVVPATVNMESTCLSGSWLSVLEHTKRFSVVTKPETWPNPQFSTHPTRIQLRAGRRWTWSSCVDEITALTMQLLRRKL